MTTATSVLLEIKRIADAAATQAAPLAPVPVATMDAMVFNGLPETVARPPPETTGSNTPDGK
jgi:hypothetical protein